jgi:phosphoglycolate phosphatase
MQSARSWAVYVLALATDYDGTIAQHGLVDEATIDSLTRFKQTGRRLVLVTGRALPDLLRVFPSIGLFDRVVVENGALLYDRGPRRDPGAWA